MKKSFTVDASVFISNVVLDDVHHALSRKFFASVKKQNTHIFVPMITICEVLHAHFRAVQDKDKTDALYQMLIDWNQDGGLSILNMDAPFLVHFEANHVLFPCKTSDAVVAITAQRLKNTLVSWDEKLLKDCKKYVSAMRPDELK